MMTEGCLEYAVVVEGVPACTDEATVGHPFGANTSNGRDSHVYLGESAGTTGLNGVGKLIPSKLSPGSAKA